MLQQLRGDNRQRHASESLATLQMNAALMAAQHQPEVAAQYQLLFNNIAK